MNLPTTCVLCDYSSFVYRHLSLGLEESRRGASEDHFGILSSGTYIMNNYVLLISTLEGQHVHRESSADRRQQDARPADESVAEASRAAAANTEATNSVGTDPVRVQKKLQNCWG